MLAALLPSVAFAEIDLPHRPISDDPVLDSHLTEPYRTKPSDILLDDSPDHGGELPVGSPLASSKGRPPATEGAETQVKDEGEQAAASVLAFRPLVGVSPLRLTWPSQGEISTYFGEVDGLSPRGHAGLDLASPYGTPIRAAAEGNVVRAEYGGAYGLVIVIEHEGGYETWYGHLSAFAVEPGARVRAGQLIGLMGSTGFSTGQHLHFEVRHEGGVQDPLKYLP
jgi:murein DD-endopeptidase MepM/ murein hydrolase activator NlpD